MKRSNTLKSQSKTEIALKESEQRYRTIMMSVGDGVIATDSAGRVEMMNPVAEELTGWKQEEAQGNSLEKIFQIINEETRQIVENPVRRVLSEGTVIGLANHTVLIAKDGTDHPIADSGAPIRNEEGDITGMVLVFRDQTQERSSQLALQESERKFRETVTYLDEGYYSVTIDGLLLDHNQAFSRILGFDIAKDLKGAKLPDFWQVPEDRKQYLNELTAHGFIRNYMVNAKKINGEKIDIMMNCHLVKDEKGGLVRIDGTVTDFTERKQAEQLIKESERKYRILVENSLVGVFRTKVNGDVDYVNDSILRMLEFDTREDLLNIGALMRYKEPKQREELLKTLKDSGKVEGFEANIITKKGNERVFLMNVVIKGEILDGTLIDITQRKLAEEIIKDNEKRFRELIESLPQLFWTCRVDGPCDYLSSQWVEYTGVPESEQLGYRWLEQLHPEDKDGTVSEWMEKVKTGSSFDIEFRIRRNDGVYHWFKTTAVPMHDSEGNIIKWFGSNTDIDEIKKAEEQLRKLNRIYSLLSDVNQAIVRTRIPNELYEKVCNIAVEQGGFGMAWLGLIDESSQKLQVIAQAGRTNGYHEQINISMNGKPLSYCPIDSALRQGKHNICKIIENKEMAPCQKIAFKLGFRSSASFPLKVYDILKGALTFYSDEPEFFDEEELKLLDELALDISFAMEYAEKETNRIRVEEALKTSEVRFRIAAETSNDVVYEWDLKQEVKWFGKIDEMLGYAPGEFPRTLDGLGASVHPEDWVHVMAAVQAHLEGRAPYAEDYRVLMKDGTSRWWSARGAVARTPEGKPVRWIGTVTDITERKLVAQELQEREARYKTLVENIPQKILMKDINYRWISINENLARDFGISPEEIVGKLDRDLFSKELADKYHADDVRIITNGKTEELEEKYMVNGKETWVNTIKTPVRDNKGEIIGLLGVLWDITGRKLAEEEIHKLNTELEGRVVMRTAQLEASNKELEAFSYSVSHDLRAPLRHVSGYVELLNKHFQSDLPEKGLHYLNSIGDSVHIMGMLIDDLLQFSRTGRMEMHQSDLDMNEIVKEVKESLSKDSPDRKIEWVLGKLPTVNGDEAMLKLVWTNLLSNAVKFTRIRKIARIEIGFRKENKELVFFVRDNGVGFDMKYAHKLFGVFQRLHSTEEFEGTGIGLANVHRIVLRQGGRTWAEAEPDKGAVFYFSIPNK